MPKKAVTPEKRREYMTRHKAKDPVAFRAMKAALNKAWIAENRERYNRAKCEHRFKLKLIALKHYSNDLMGCAHCGYSVDVDALCLDHINNDGAAHRRENKLGGRGLTSGANIYERLRAMKWPKIFQVLCFNCNTIKELRRKRGATSAELTAKVNSGPTHWRVF